MRHWTDSLFSFTLTRDPAFASAADQIHYVGLQVTANRCARVQYGQRRMEDTLEFLSIKVPTAR